MWTGRIGPLRAVYKDLDFVTVKNHAARFNALLVEAGDEADERFNTLHGAQRLLHYDRLNGKQLEASSIAWAQLMTRSAPALTRPPTQGQGSTAETPELELILERI